MLMTGFLSLNVHDSLTFDGAELCLHPDLFPISSTSATGSTNGGNHTGLAPGDMIEIRVWDPLPQSVIASSASSAASITTAIGPTSVINTPASTPVSTLNRSPPEPRRNNSANNSLAGTLTPTGGNTSVISNQNLRLAPSLMKTPTPFTTPNPASSHPTPAQPSNSAASTPTAGSMSYASAVAGTSTAPAIPNESVTNVPSKIQTTNLRPRAPSLTNSLAYSVESENPQSGTRAVVDANSSNQSVDTSASTVKGGDDHITTKSVGEESNGSASAQDAATAATPPTYNLLSKSPITSPATSVTLPSAAAANAAATTASLPPVFPRGQGSTSDTVSLMGTLHKPKPIGMTRRSRTVASTTNTTGSNTAPTSSRPLAYPSKATGPLHSRDISDVTVDTQQLDNMDLLQAAGLYSDGNTDHLIPPENSFPPRQNLANAMANVSTGSDSKKLRSTHSLRLSFVLLVTNQTLTTLKGNTRTQISMLRQVADLYALSRYDTVTVHKITKEDEEEALKAVSADYVVVTIKDQFISRGDMLYFQHTLKGSWIYEGERLMEQSKGIKAHAREIRHGNASAKSGIVTDETMITFRSRSARIFWLVQLSSEMWEYSSPYDPVANQVPICEIYFDKWIRFLHKLFTKWKVMEVTHSLTVIFFSRTLIYNGENSTFKLADVYGRPYEDHFKTVIENETCMDWHSLLVRIKEAFVQYPFEVGWSLDRRPTNASQGNVLEAINLTLNVMQFHYLDRDLHRTGNSLVVISPGCGIFEVNKRLAEITYKRMMDHGIGSDMLSLGLPPLHIAPIFLYAVDPRAGTETSGGHYEVPHWMHLSFINYDRDDGVGHQEEKKDSSPVSKNKILRSWMDSYEVASNGFLRPKIDVEGRIGPGDGDRAKSFSAIGNAAATPVKAKSEAKQERQLIEGRDFRDILDACRPKVRSVIPSPLLFILKQIVDQDETGQTKWMDEARASPLVEWGTANTAEMIAQDRLLIQHLQSKSRKKKDVAQSGRANSESGSSTSSKVDYSQILSTTPLSTSPKIFQLQRSNSIKLGQMSFLPKRAPSPSMLNDDSLSASASTASGSSLGKHSLEMKSTLETKAEVTIGSNPDESGMMDQNQHIMHLRQLMEDHDAVVCSPLLAEVQPSSEVQRLSNTKRSISPAVTSRKKSPHHGGLGDALSRYETKKPRESARTLRSLSDLHQTSFKQDRPRKSSPLLNPKSERGQRAISPVMLSPPDSELNQTHPHATNKDETSHSFSRHVSTRDSRLHAHRSGFGSTNTLPALDLSNHGGSPTSQFRGSSASGMRQIYKQKPHLLSKSPPVSASRLQSGTYGSKVGQSSSPSRSGSRDRSGHRRSRSAANSRNGVVPQRQASYNPFRQSDEDEVLATRSHERRRWSHVFAEGEVEFKRHAGPIWNSLTSPAILPLSVDYLPSPQEMRDERRFLFTPYSITLSGIEKSFYNTHDELIMEMVRMRVTQDYQIVTAKAVRESNNRVEKPREGRGGVSTKRRGKFDRNSEPDKNEASKHYLSMGHIIQVIHYDPSNDTIAVVVYLEARDYDNYKNYYDYEYLLYSDATNQYVKSSQTFAKFKEIYRWNMSDNIMYEVSEKAYVSKFKRLLEYLGRLREKEEAKTDLGVEIMTSSDCAEPNLETLPSMKKANDSFVQFIVRLQRGKQDPVEWLQISIESVFVPTRSYKIFFNWLVGSSSKVEGQIQLLHRRCSQFGLRLVAIPHTTTFENLQQHAFSVPTFICVRSKETVDGLDALLKSKDFIYEGVEVTKPGRILQSIENRNDYNFERFHWAKKKFHRVASKQYIHRSGALVVRMIPDSQGLAILALIENRKNASRENNFKEIARNLMLDLQQTIKDYKKAEPKMTEEEKKLEVKMAEEKAEESEKAKDSEKLKPKPVENNEKAEPKMIEETNKLRQTPIEVSEQAEAKMVEPRASEEIENAKTKVQEDNQKPEANLVEESERIEPKMVETKWAEDNQQVEAKPVGNSEKIEPKMVEENDKLEQTPAKESAKAEAKMLKPKAQEEMENAETTLQEDNEKSESNSAEESERMEPKMVEPKAAEESEKVKTTRVGGKQKLEPKQVADTEKIEPKMEEESVETTVAEDN